MTDKQETPEALSDEEAFNQMVAEDPDLSDSEPPEKPDEPDEPDEFDKAAAEAAGEGLGDDGPREPEQEEEPETPEEESDDSASNEPEWFAEIPEDLREKVRTDFDLLRQQNIHLDSRYKAQHGQLAPIQRKNAILNDEVKRLRELADARGERVNPPQREKIDRWIKQHGEDFPEEAAELRELVKGYADTVESENQRLRQQHQQSAPDVEVDVDEQTSLLLNTHPDALQIGHDPQFKHWFSQQDRETQERFRSDYANDVIQVLDRFQQSVPDWRPPVYPEDFLSAPQAAASPIFKDWARERNINPADVHRMDEWNQVQVLNAFKADLQAVVDEMKKEQDGGQPDPQPTPEKDKRVQRRQQALKDRDPEPKSTPVTGVSTLNDPEAYFEHLVNSDPDLAA